MSKFRGVITGLSGVRFWKTISKQSECSRGQQTQHGLALAVGLSSGDSGETILTANRRFQPYRLPTRRNSLPALPELSPRSDCKTEYPACPAAGRSTVILTRKPCKGTSLSVINCFFSNFSEVGQDQFSIEPQDKTDEPTTRQKRPQKLARASDSVLKIWKIVSN
ncbi:hypothetical protein, partial [Thermogutta sp.]|uniref:hypothetical protein n=1 Tax=Thermogutta sp. TaxID=1962930 RepID=UPI0025FA1492